MRSRVASQRSNASSVIRVLRFNFDGFEAAFADLAFQRAFAHANLLRPLGDRRSAPRQWRSKTALF